MVTIFISEKYYVSFRVYLFMYIFFALFNYFVNNLFHSYESFKTHFMVKFETLLYNLCNCICENLVFYHHDINRIFLNLKWANPFQHFVLLVI